MQKLIIEGGNPLNGTIRIQGSKNVTLPLIAASLLTNEDVQLVNVPDITDIHSMLNLIIANGANLTLNGDAIIENDQEYYATILNTSNVKNGIIKNQIARQMRASIVLLGPMLTRFGHVEIPLPGGCTIGERPIDIHIDGLTAMGAEIKIIDNILFANGKLHGAEINLRFKSVGATQNLLMAAVLAEGTTIIKNASFEPEVQGLTKLLLEMGAKIEGAFTDTLIVEGKKLLNGAKFFINPDRMEAASYAILAVATNGKIRMKDVNLNLFDFCQKEFQDLGINLTKDGADIIANAGTRKDNITITTDIYPGFATDIQPQITAFLSTYNLPYKYTVVEALYENRLMGAKELIKMNANIKFLSTNKIEIISVPNLSATDVISHDLRCGFALMIAALQTKGKTKILNSDPINRGYSNFVRIISSLGGKIRYED